MIEAAYGDLVRIVEAAAGPTGRLFPLYLLTAAALAFFVYATTARARSGRGFLRWLFPRGIWLHPSHLVDLKLFVVNRVGSAFGLFNNVAVTSLVSVLVMLAASGRPEDGDAASTWLVALCVLLANDFGVYWVHRLHHENRFFWPFHAVHHSAEVMTPITVYRKHPVYDLISSAVRGVFYGLLQGLLLVAFFGPVEASTVIGVNAFYFAFNVFGANLRHSHVWLSFGPVIEHLFISPAQHQIHHSRAVEHHDKNYGEVLAVWDWVFGTLYVPKRRERLSFGLADGEGRPIEQPHGGLRAALVGPVRDAAAVVLRRGDGDAARR